MCLAIRVEDIAHRVITLVGRARQCFDLDEFLGGEREQPLGDIVAFHACLQASGRALSTVSGLELRRRGCGPQIVASIRRR